MDIIDKLKTVLDSNIYTRKNPNQVIQTFLRLNVKVSKIVEEFFLNFEDHFGKKR